MEKLILIFVNERSMENVPSYFYKFAVFQNQKPIKEQFILNAKKAMGKKYMQEHNIFKQKQDEPKKQHRQIVMSEEFIKSSKLYRLLKEKMDRSDSIFIKQVNAINEQKMKFKEQIMQLKSQNYQEKLGLWELKNKLMELKIVLHEEQQESKRLAEQNYGQYDEQQQQEGENGENQEQQNIQEEQNAQQEKSQQIHIFSKNIHQHIRDERKDVVGQNENEIVHEQRKKEYEQNKHQFSEILKELMSLKSEHEKLQEQQKDLEQPQESNQLSEGFEQRNLIQDLKNEENICSDLMICQPNQLLHAQGSQHLYKHQGQKQDVSLNKQEQEPQ